MHQLVVDPIDILGAPFGDLPEIEHADLVQQFAQHRPHAVDPFELVRVAERRLDEQVGFVVFAPGRVDGVDVAGRWG